MKYSIKESLRILSSKYGLDSLNHPDIGVPNPRLGVYLNLYDISRIS